MMVSFSTLSTAAGSPFGHVRSVDITVENVNVQANQTFDVVINVGDVTGLEITAFNFALLYDASLVRAIDVSLDGTLGGSDAADMTLVYNADGSGRIAIAAAGVAPLVGAGALVVVSFESLDQDGIVAIEFEEIILNEGSPEAIGNSGSIAVSTQLPGDASLNGELSAFDAARVLQHAAFIDTLTTSAFVAGEVSGNNEISSYDAALILQRVAGLIGCFPVEDGCGVTKNGSVANEVEAEVSWGPARPDGMVVHVPLMIERVQGDIRAMTVEIIASEEIDFTYDIQSRLPDGWVVVHAKGHEGNLRIVMAGLEPLSPGTVFELESDNPEALRNAKVTINEQAALEVDRLVLDEQPEDFSLMQNYPNPFNPTTTISYTITEALNVTLIVYDLLGREVTRLVDGIQEAGAHAASFDAGSLSSGTYIYRLEAGPHTQTRQMTLVK